MTHSLTDYGVVLVTTSSKEEGEAIAASLVESKLAACVTLLPVQSIYTWQGKVNNDSEWQLMIKTRLDKFAELSAKIKSLHSYQVPEIIAIPIIAGSQSYLDWIGDNVN